MKIGDTLQLRHPQSAIVEKELVVVDDCYRLTSDRCTILVKEVGSNIHFEIDIKEIQSGQDI